MAVAFSQLLKAARALHHTATAFCSIPVLKQHFQTRVFDTANTIMRLMSTWSLIC